MAELVADCPRCGAQKITFDVKAQNAIGVQYDWQHWFEIFCVCRNCKRATIFRVSQKEAGDQNRAFFSQQGPVEVRGAINRVMDVVGYVSVSDAAAMPPPEHLPENISAAFVEGAKCAAIKCHNAAGTMFRLCVDLATRSRLPEADAPGLNPKVRRDLGLRLPWLFDNGLLPGDLRELSTCVKDDGNDGAHQGTLQKEDAADLLDFAYALLERLYTEPERLKIAKQRRDERRKPEK